MSDEYVVVKKDWIDRVRDAHEILDREVMDRRNDSTELEERFMTPRDVLGSALEDLILYKPSRPVLV